MLSNEVVETEDGSFPPLASTVAMMRLADGMKNAGERKQEDNPSVFTHRHFFPKVGYIRLLSLKSALMYECGDRTQRAKELLETRQVREGMMRITQAITTRGLDSMEPRTAIIQIYRLGYQ